MTSRRRSPIYRLGEIKDGKADIRKGTEESFTLSCNDGDDTHTLNIASRAVSSLNACRDFDDPNREIQKLLRIKKLAQKKE